MKRMAICVFCAGSLIATQAADARGLGRLLSALIGRGVASGVARDVASGVARGVASGVVREMRKSYTADVLTVDQLVRCLKEASALDQESDDIELKRQELRTFDSDIDHLKNQLQIRQATLNRYSQVDVDGFNVEVDRYNTAIANVRSRENSFNAFINIHNSKIGSYNVVCVKKYYADDMEEARKLAGI